MIRCALIALVLLLTGCAALRPADDKSLLPGATAAAPGLVILVHGSGFGPNDWPAALAAELDPLLGTGWEIVRVDWESTAARRLSAPRNGHALGRRIGTQIAAGRPRVLHLIAHSVGSFVIQGIIDGIRESDDTQTVIHATFLDPFLARSPLQPRYGVRRFGIGADCADSYFTRDDAVPFTNRPLNRAWNLELDNTVPDLTDAPVDWSHTWPVTWYMESVSDTHSSLPIPGAPLLGLSHNAETLNTARQIAHQTATRFQVGALVRAGVDP